jgi:putative transposase
MHGSREPVRSDNGPEFIAKDVQRCLDRAAARTLYFGKASRLEGGCVEMFNGTCRDGPLYRELFLSLEEVRYVLDEWRLDFDDH